MMAVGLTMSTAIYAQEEPQLVVKPSGRILFDAAYVDPQHQEDKLNSGLDVPHACGCELYLWSVEG